MELRHLRYFVAVCGALNFTKAAAQLRVAQPSLGRQVQDLEDEIGVDLLKRSPRGVTITAEGKLFLEEAREVLKRVDESVEQDYPEFYLGLDRIFSPLGIKPRIAVECDGISSLITEVETGRGVAFGLPVFKQVIGKRLLYRPLAGTIEVISVGIARAKNGDLTPAGERFCESLRKASDVAIKGLQRSRAQFGDPERSLAITRRSYLAPQERHLYS